MPSADSQTTVNEADLTSVDRWVVDLVAFAGKRRPKLETVLLGVEPQALSRDAQFYLERRLGELMPLVVASNGELSASLAALAIRQGPTPPLVLRVCTHAPGDLADLARRWPGEGGRLLLALPKTQRREAIDELSQAGFAVLREQPCADRLVLEARPTSYVVRTHHEGDEAAILDLFPTSFHVSRSLEHWTWKYLSSPFGGPHITTAWDGQGQLAAHYAAYPVPITSGGRAGAQAMQVGDTMTAAGARHVGRGPTSLLGRTVRHFYAVNCEGRVAFNFGFNTGNIRRFSQRFVRATAVEPVVVWSAQASQFSGPCRTPFLLRTGVEERADERWDRFFDRVAPRYGTLVHRSANWINWRYVDCPDAPPFRLIAAHRFGRLLGWAVFRRRAETLLWCDALVDPSIPGLFPHLVRSALAQPEFEAVERVEGWAPRRPDWWVQELEGAGFQAAAHPDDLSLMVVPFEWHEAPEKLGRSFYYAMGDGDLA